MKSKLDKLLLCIMSTQEKISAATAELDTHADALRELIEEIADHIDDDPEETGHKDADFEGLPVTVAGYVAAFSLRLHHKGN